jgi:L-lactate dehydrogenase (cytochrome)
MGRAYVDGLGALGQRGVATALEVIRRELDLTMALCGTRSIAEIDQLALEHGRPAGLAA